MVSWSHTGVEGNNQLSGLIDAAVEEADGVVRKVHKESLLVHSHRIN